MSRKEIYRKCLAIDFEVANSNLATPCAFKICIIEDFKIIDTLEFLINPDTQISYWNIKFHGITMKDVVSSPLFPQVWEEVSHLFYSYPIIIAHNAAFNISVLLHVLYRYNLDFPDFQYICTLETSSRLNFPVMNNELTTLCNFFEMNLSNYNDACAELFLLYIEEFGEEIFKNSNVEDLLPIEYKEVLPLDSAFPNLNYVKLFDLDSIAGKSVVITGEPKKELTDILSGIGCIIKSGVSKKVDFVVVGIQDRSRVIDEKNCKSVKILEAETLRLQGINIKFIKGGLIKTLAEDKYAIKV